MAKGHKPVSGSRAYWPRKRTKRIYPRLKYSSEYLKKASETTGVTTGVKPLMFAGYKAGMTHVVFRDNRRHSVTSGQEIAKPVTVVDISPLVVMGIKLYKSGQKHYKTAGTILAENLNKDLIRKLKLPKKLKTKDSIEKFEKRIGNYSDIRLLVHTKPKECGLGKKKPEVFELDLSGNVADKWNYAKEKLGKEIDVREVFSEGEYADAKAVTKGKGFQGVVKRFCVKIRGRKHGTKRRHIGNLAPRTPARILPGAVAMAGQMGFQTRTELNKRILKIGSDGLSPRGGFVNYGMVSGDYLLVEGSVPGPKKRLIMFRRAIRALEKKEPVEITYISMESQQ